MAAPVLGVKMLCFLEQTDRVCSKSARLRVLRVCSSECQTSDDSEVLGLSLGLMQAKLLLWLAVLNSNELLIEPLLLPATHTI